MLPISDLNPTRRIPFVTYILIGINVIVFLWQLVLPRDVLAEAFVSQSIVPYLVTREGLTIETILDFIRSMFFHGGWLHLLGNMLYLWIFGDNIEDRLGWLLYIVFYLACGFIAGLTQVLIDPTSRIPLVGASGAIAGVLGAYALMFPGVKVRGLLFMGYFSRLTELPALAVLGFWFVLQLFDGFTSLGANNQGGGVAFFAHIGGFVAGAVLIWLFMRVVPQPPVAERVDWLYEMHKGQWM